MNNIPFYIIALSVVNSITMTSLGYIIYEILKLRKVRHEDRECISDARSIIDLMTKEQDSLKNEIRFTANNDSKSLEMLRAIIDQLTAQLLEKNKEVDDLKWKNCNTNRP